MSTIHPISFKAESSNLLQAALAKKAGEPVKPLTESVAVTKPSAEDKFVSEAPKKKSFKAFMKEYSGMIALATSLVAVPLTYLFTKRSGAKQIAGLEHNIAELTEQIKALTENAAKPTPQKLASKVNSLVTVLLGIGTGAGIAGYVKNNKKELNEMGYSDKEIESAQSTAKDLVEKPDIAVKTAEDAYGISKGLDDKINAARTTAEKAKSTAESMDSRVNAAQNRADEALGAATSGVSPSMQKFLQKYYDLWIMRYPGWEKKINNSRSEVAMSSVRNAAGLRLDRSAKQTLSDIKSYKDRYKDKLSSTWALTAEFKPIKLGGLGDVPVDLQDNFTKLGIDNPVFIPMYETPGTSTFVDSAGTNPKYRYNGKTFNLRKMADMNVEVFKNGQQKPEKVEFYVSEENGKKLIFVRNESFKGAIYDSTTSVDEPEKFAVFTKAVYQLAQAKVAEALDEPLSSHPYITKYAAYSELEAPNSMILNDWHAGTMAGLMRYKAPMQYNYNEIGQNVFDALSNMPLLMIGHNLKVQGASNQANNGDIKANNNVAQNIINTLYDHYAMGIVENAHSGIENEDLCNTILLKRTTSDKQFNSLFHGIALADWFVPVSKNYSNEIVNDVYQSGITQPLLARRKATGTIEGIINGTDLVKHNMHKVASNNYVKGLVLEEYDKNSNIEQIMKFRAENKRRFYHTFIKPMFDNSIEKLEVVNPSVGRKDISEEEFVNAPLLSFAHRLTDQKGLVLLKGAIFRLFDNWDKEFGDKPKPFFLVGGPPESAEEVGHLEALKNPEYGENKERVDHVFALKGNMPNPAIMAVSTYFCAPSTFEPCGLTQGECFAKGTPIIATDTGGYHDTVEDGKTGFLAPQISEDAVYNTIVKALHMYFDDQQSYQNMIMNDLNIDFSWARAGRKGPIYEYTDKLGYSRRKLPDIATAA